MSQTTTMGFLLHNSGHPFVAVEDPNGPYVIIADAALAPMFFADLHRQELGGNDLIRRNASLLVHAANQMPSVLRFLEDLSRMTTDREMDGNMSGDDACSTLSQMIERSRELLGAVSTVKHLGGPK